MLAIVIEAAIRSSVLIVVVWLGLKVFGTNNPHSLMPIWRLVLLSSLASPFIVGRLIFSIEFDVPSPLLILSGDSSIQLFATDFIPFSLRNYSGLSQHFNWGSLAASIYLIVAGGLLMRLAVGTALGWWLRRCARSIYEDWTAGKDVRSSRKIKAPGTFGSTILLPDNYSSWNVLDRRAIMVHEESHVRRGDFYILLLAAINKSLFWFNPFAYWLNNKIVYLAESRSDAAAIEDIEDRIHYAELLLRLKDGSCGSPKPAMAKSDTVARRVEQLLSETHLPSKIGWTVRVVIIACVLPLAAISVGLVTQASSPQKVGNTAMTSGPDLVAKRGEESSLPRTEMPSDSRQLDSHFELERADSTGIPQHDPLFSQLSGRGLKRTA
ncbi:M56 family metallopeptidase [Rhodomicrobium lacus]|uniref:M56 family metallopeptidase n=1 Tax=Rhodomicrobium lacus TaxID=2498452 RepID=UPI0026E247A9|nr:M56 family metallopeptidase [Rhodomicrobium lacus]WKW52055.1 M56 family metallopeptidase [Rhodomicrobium lacus]